MCVGVLSRRGVGGGCAGCRQTLAGHKVAQAAGGLRGGLRGWRYTQQTAGLLKHQSEPPRLIGGRFSAAVKHCGKRSHTPTSRAPKQFIVLLISHSTRNTICVDFVFVFVSNVHVKMIRGWLEENGGLQPTEIQALEGERHHVFPVTL